MRLFSAILIVLVIGCSPLQMRKIAFGTSLQDFNTAEKKRTKIVAIKPADCFKQVNDTLSEKKAIIAKSDSKNNFIVAYGFNDFYRIKPDQNIINTTEVGILLKETSEGKTEIIIISDDFRLAEFIADELFKKLEAK